MSEKLVFEKWKIGRIQRFALILVFAVGFFRTFSLGSVSFVCELLI